MLGPRRSAPQGRQDAAPAPEAAETPPGPEEADDGDVNPWAAVYGASPGADTRQRLEALRSSPWRR